MTYIVFGGTPSLTQSITHYTLNVLAHQKLHHDHRRRSGWNSGGRMASAEGGSVPSGMGYWEGCPLPSRLKGLGERLELPQRGPGRTPAKTDFGVF